MISVHQARQLGWGTRCVDLRVVSFHCLGCCTTAVASACFRQCKFEWTVTWRLITFQLRAGTPRLPLGNARVLAVAHRSARLTFALAQPAPSGTRAHPALAVCSVGRLCTCSGPISTFPWYVTTIFGSPCADAPRSAWWCAKYGAIRPLRRSRCTRQCNTARTICNVLTKYGVSSMCALCGVVREVVWSVHLSGVCFALL